MIKHNEYGACTTYAVPVMHSIKQKYLTDAQFKTMWDSTSEEDGRFDSEKIEVSDALLEYIFEIGFIEGQKAGVADTTKIFENRLRDTKEFYDHFISATFPWERETDSNECCNNTNNSKKH